MLSQEIIQRLKRACPKGSPVRPALKAYLDRPNKVRAIDLKQKVSVALSCLSACEAPTDEGKANKEARQEVYEEVIKVLDG